MRQDEKAFQEMRNKWLTLPMPERTTLPGFESAMRYAWNERGKRQLELRGCCEERDGD